MFCHFFFKGDSFFDLLHVGPLLKKVIWEHISIKVDSISGVDISKILLYLWQIV